MTLPADIVLMYSSILHSRGRFKELIVPLQGNAACALLILEKMEDSFLSLTNNALQT